MSLTRPPGGGGLVFSCTPERSADGMDRTDDEHPDPGLPGSLRQDAMAIARPLTPTPPGRRIGLVGLAVAMSALLGGCRTTPPALRTPVRPVAPYAAVIAVAPLANESGVAIDPRTRAEVSDDLIASINQVEGWAAVPLDRTLSAMASLGMAEVRSEADARQLIATIGVDGILVGTITQWNPYDPPRFGANVLLIGDDARLRTSIDPQALYGRTGDADSATGVGTVRPVTDLVVDLDAVDHGTRRVLRDYADARIDVTGGFDPPERYYLMVFHRYLRFATDQIVAGLVERERLRLRSGG